MYSDAALIDQGSEEPVENKPFHFNLIGLA